MKCSSLGDAFPPCLQHGHVNYADGAESSPPFWPLVTEVVTGFLQALRIPTSEWNSKVLHFRWFCTEAMLATARGFCRKSQISPCSLDEITHRMDLCSGFKDIMTTLRCPQSCSLSRAWSVAVLPSWVGTALSWRGNRVRCVLTCLRSWSRVLCSSTSLRQTICHMLWEALGRHSSPVCAISPGILMLALTIRGNLVLFARTTPLWDFWCWPDSAPRQGQAKLQCM